MNRSASCDNDVPLALGEHAEPPEHTGIEPGGERSRRHGRIVADRHTLSYASRSTRGSSVGLRIEETSASGSVPELLVVNPLDEHVLLYDGEELAGAKQNRILDVTVLAGAKSALPIPVSCVEEGRWRTVSSHFGSAGHISHAELRHRKSLALAAEPLTRGLAQGEVWDAVRDKASARHPQPVRRPRPRPSPAR